MTDYTIAVLEDAIHILNILQRSGEGLSLALLTEYSGFLKNKVFRILYTLEKHQLVERDSNGNYRLGSGLNEIRQPANRYVHLIEASQHAMDELVVATGESIFLGVAAGFEALCIAARESPRSVRLFAQVGRRVSLHLGGVPKTLLAYLPPDQRKTAIQQIQQRADPAIDAARLEQMLESIRRLGYAVVEDDLDVGAHSVAAPINDYTGQVVGAMSIAGPSMRFTDRKVTEYIDLIVSATKEVSYVLGYVAEKTSLEISP